eukprot:gi/632987959/ref/XP_007882845.1/ PREDICTED: deleted in malignant brain tumors 1 protein-like [Callorhinchus milii]
MVPKSEWRAQRPQVDSQAKELDHLRLVSGSSPCAGRVEVYHDGQWGTVYGSGWDLKAAAVVCKELGCGAALSAPGDAHFGEGTSPKLTYNAQCKGNESALRDCESDRGEDSVFSKYSKSTESEHDYYEYFSSDSSHAGVICSDRLRLLNGSSPCAGRVEVYHDGQWGTVNGNASGGYGWDMLDAAVVCQQLGCGAALSASGDAHFGEGSDPVVTDHVQCSGSESTLRDCQSQPWGHYSWSYSSDAGVICSDYLRLVNGGRPCAGRVEVYHDGQWGTVDGSGSGDSAWDMLDAAVVCKELGCGAALSASGDAHFGEGSGPVVTRSVRCRGSESTLRDCQSYPWSDSSWLSHSYDAGVICSGTETPRLVNGGSRCSGRVELYTKETWGTVCGDILNIEIAEYICKSLECGFPVSVSGDSRFGEGSGPVIGRPDCGHERDGGIICSEYNSLKLVGGNNNCSGTVTLKRDYKSGTICDYYWDLKDADVLCRQLDCGFALLTGPGAQFGKETGRIWKTNFN